VLLLDLQLSAGEVQVKLKLTCSFRVCHSFTHPVPISGSTTEY